MWARVLMCVRVPTRGTLAPSVCVRLGIPLIGEHLEFSSLAYQVSDVSRRSTEPTIQMRDHLLSLAVSTQWGANLSYLVRGTKLFTHLSGCVRVWWRGSLYISLSHRGEREMNPHLPSLYSV